MQETVEMPLGTVKKVHESLMLAKCLAEVLLLTHEEFGAGDTAIGRSAVALLREQLAKINEGLSLIDTPTLEGKTEEA